MPIEPDVIALLAQPTTAAAQVFILVSTLGYIAYRIPADWALPKQEKYLRIASFFSEVFVAVGLIGLVTFAGRAKLDHNEIERLEATRSAEMRLSKSFVSLAASYCIDLPSLSLPANTYVAAYDACKIWRRYNAIYRADLDWDSAKKELSRIEDSPQIDPRLTELLKSIEQEIGIMMDARRKQALAPHERQIITEQVSWFFVLLCSVFATLGVSLKCARAARELRNQFIQSVATSSSVQTRTPLTKNFRTQPRRLHRRRS